jgi:phospholipase C
MDGFVRASGPVAMGYWTDDDIPFYYGLAKTFPLCDRWFCSTLAQTYPNRRFLLAGTASGIVATDITKLGVSPPPNGVIMDRFEQYDISWKNYYTTCPVPRSSRKVSPVARRTLTDISHFYSDAAAGKLRPSASSTPTSGRSRRRTRKDIRAR